MIINTPTSKQDVLEMEYRNKKSNLPDCFLCDTNVGNIEVANVNGDKKIVCEACAVQFKDFLLYNKPKSK